MKRYLSCQSIFTHSINSGWSYEPGHCCLYMKEELFYQIAITMVPNIGDVNARALVQYFGSASAVFKVKAKHLEEIEGIGVKRIESILKFDFAKVDDEIAFIQKHKIQTLFFQDKGFPKRLLNCYDCPALLYYKGNTDLNAEKMVGIVGTRSQSEYGKSHCESIIETLAAENVIIVSGLAFGIDTIAHKSALKSGIQTIGVLAHGLDRIYPTENKSIAKEMLQQGGLLTEFRSNTIPDKQNFPSRNRIVAGLCDCIIVIESGKKGGSLITAELANGYNRDVFTIPGRITDLKSEGCNYLIKTNKAALITSGEDVLRNMGWFKEKKPTKKKQRELFIELPADEKTIYNILKESGSQHIDDLFIKCNLSGSSIAKALLMLEMEGIVKSLPGKVYELE